MRIISGKYKGRKLDLPSSIRIRPTTDMAKEALFSILSVETDISGAKVLDLFCGTGSISYEFASRGADHVTAVDVMQQSRIIINKICGEIGIDNIRPVKANVFSMLKNQEESFDIIFADPPFAEKKIPLIPDLIFDNNFLNPGGLLVVEHPTKFKFDEHPRFYKHKNYGTVNFSFFR